MKGQQADDLVAVCAKLASKAPKVEAYLIVYETKNGTIHTQRGGSSVMQLGLTKLSEKNIMRDFTVSK